MKRIGRGSVLIQEACRANGLPEPQWTADENSVTLTFTAKSGMSRQVVQDGGREKSVEKGKEKSKEKSKEKMLALLSAMKKHKLESRLPGEIPITSDMQMTPPLWQKVKRN